MSGDLFHTEADRREMLRSIGADSVQDIIDAQVPSALQMRRALDLPTATDEMTLEREIRRLAAGNASAASHVCFIGGGAYDHFIPAVVEEIASRSEFHTSSVPYQAEASQGTLQMMFEYQTLICQITGMDVSNPSTRDGGSAATEAVSMALTSANQRNKVVTSDAVHPQYRDMLSASLKTMDAELVVVESDESGTSATIIDAIDDQTACVLIQHPNFFGRMEQVQKISDAAHVKDALVIQSFDPISVGLLKRPGDMGVDIAVAEGQCLGNPLQYGGPYLGIMACRKDLMPQMPGGIACQTTDRRGNRCWTLTPQPREQNQTLPALRAAVFLSLLGPQGLKETAEQCVVKTNLARIKFAASERFELVHPGPVFKEFVVRDRQNDVKSLIDHAARHGILAGAPLAGMGSRYDDCFLVAVTEKRTKSELDRLMEIIEATPTQSSEMAQTA